MIFKSSGEKKYHMDIPEKLACLFDGDPADSDSFRFILLKVHVNADLHSPFICKKLDMGFFIVEMDDLLILASAVRFRSGAYVNGFQYVCFSLGVVPVKDIGAGIKIDMQFFVITVIQKLQGILQT